GVFVKTLQLNPEEGSAYLAVETTAAAEKSKTAELNLAITRDGTPVSSITRRVWLEKGENTFPIKTMLHGITPWSPETPVMYDVTVTLTTDACCDCETVSFGIRTVANDPVRGFLLNGKPLKLYGTCNHHDNGIVGAASFRSAEERRVRILRENGFNAIRTAHNPPSSVLLDVCDRMGMLVIDELFDAWRIGKKEFDYHIWFEENFLKDASITVRRDRNHPSVVLWSTGNEIPEKNGVSNGYRTAGAIARVIRSLDDTRLVTHALCTFWDNPEYARRDDETRDYPADRLDFFSEKTSCVADLLDVVGYNYLLFRLEKDFVRFPDRLVAMTESFPMDAVAVKRAMDRYPRFIGEFVWTGWDYFGETGIGHTEDGEGETWGLTSYPEHTANCGDFDICGFKNPQSYYRDAAWKKGSVRILAGSPADFERKYKISAWGFWRVGRSWNFDRQTEGFPATVYVFTMADECELWQDGVSLGRKKPDERGVAAYTVPYHPGKLEAAAYEKGEPCGRDVLESAGEAVSLEIFPDCTGETGKADLLYAEICLVDAKGRRAAGSEGTILVTADGAVVLGTGSGDGKSEHDYTSNECETHHGRMLAALLPDENVRSVTLRAVWKNGTGDVTKTCEITR
ncbi:MAG: glycoside hydrolase family 2 TIM barrel-domain containing protein, partial [Eubacteriales bacterium]